MTPLRGQRGLFLPVLIIAFGVAVLAATFALILDKNLLVSLGPLPRWFNAFLLALLAARLAALYGIWDLRRVAVFGLLGLEIVELCTGLFVFASGLGLPQRLLGGIPLFLVLASVWYIALRPKWRLFR